MEIQYTMELIPKANYYSRKMDGDQGWPIPLDQLSNNEWLLQSIFSRLEDVLK
jgi:hypothetical protein